MRKTIGWWMMAVIALLAIMTANDYKKSGSNLASFSQLLADLGRLLPTLFTNGYFLILSALLLIGGVVYHISKSKSSAGALERLDALETASPLQDHKVMEDQKLRYTKTYEIDSIILAIEKIVTSVSMPMLPSEEMLLRYISAVKMDHPVWKVGTNNSERKAFLTWMGKALTCHRDNGGLNKDGFPVSDQERKDMLSNLRGRAAGVIGKLKAYKRENGDPYS